MKIRILIPLTFLYATTFSAIAVELSQGPAIAASDLAKQLNILSASIDYKQDTPFSKLTVGLIYKEREDSGEFKEKVELVYTTFSLPKSTMRQTITVFVSPDASTTILGGASARGKGISLPAPNSVSNPPDILKDGNYAFVTLYSDSKGNSGESIKGILELVVKPAE